MLILSLILSGLLLLIVNLIARNVRHAGGLIAFVSLGFLLGPPFFLWFVSPAVALQALLLWAAVLVWRVAGRGPSLFTALSFGATLAAYGLAGMLVVQTNWEYARLRLRYPYESMEARLSPAQPVPASLALSPAGMQRLSRVEQGVAAETLGYREHQLQLLHEHAIDLFINSPGFGQGRMVRPSEWSLASQLRREPVPRQPGTRAPLVWSPGEGAQSTAELDSPLGGILEASIIDFVNPRGFGYVKDRRHVAGFDTHRFSRVPEPAEHWRVQTLELVSVLLHDEPVVYVSDHLPRMEPRAGVATRPLDRFERYSLGSLRQGEDLFIAAENDGLRMVGAVRSTAQCVVCHDCRRGDLLGAFSYTLKRDARPIADQAE
jgi:hypothetical protein